MAQLVKNPPAMWETWVQSLGWEDPLEKGKGYPLQYSGLSQTQLSNFHFSYIENYKTLMTEIKDNTNGWRNIPCNFSPFEISSHKTLFYGFCLQSYVDVALLRLIFFLVAQLYNPLTK